MKVFFSALVARMHSVKNSQYLNHCLHQVCPFRPKTFNCWDYSLLNLSLSLQLWCSLQSNLYIEFFPTIRAPWFHGLTCRVELGSSTLRGIFCRIFSPGRQSAACPRSCAWLFLNHLLPKWLSPCCERPLSFALLDRRCVSLWNSVVGQAWVRERWRGLFWRRRTRRQKLPFLSPLYLAYYIVPSRRQMTTLRPSCLITLFIRNSCLKGVLTSKVASSAAEVYL